MPTVRQVGFVSGEIAPLLYGRTDHPRYGQAARTIRNFLVLPQGPLQNRPGTKLVASTKDPTQKAILVPFVYFTTAYLLEFGNLYVRFHRAGGLILNAGIPFELVTPFTTAMLPYLSWSQSGARLTLTYGGQVDAGVGVQPQDLLKTGAADTAWTIGNSTIYFDVQASTGESTSLAVDIFAWAVGTNYQMGDRVTGNNQEYISLQNNNLGNVLPAAGASNAFWGLANDAPHPGVAVSYAQTPVLQEKATGLIYEGKASASSPVSYVGPLSKDRPIRIRLSRYDGAGATDYRVLYFRIFRAITANGIYGWIGDVPATQTTFVDEGIAPDYTQQPPSSLVTSTETDRDPFLVNAVDNWPALVAFFEQRRIFARSSLRPMDVWGSKTGEFYRWDRPYPVVATTPVNFTLASENLDEIRSLVPVQSIFAFTQSGVWTIRGYQGSPLTGNSVNARKQQHAVGASWTRPARVGDAIIYEQDGGGAIQEFVYDQFYDFGRANDVSAIARHMLEGHTVVQMAYSARPNKIVWIVRDDGVLLGLTYVRSQDPAQPGVVAWHQHTTDGLFEGVCVVPEGTEDVLYAIVNRTINGVTKRYVERMQTRLVTDARLGVFLDAALTFDGRNAGATTMKFTSGSTYAGGEEGTILASAASFVPDDVGSVIVLDPDAVAGGPFRLTVLAFTDATHVTAQLDTPNLPAAFQAVATTSWGWARRRFFGLGHLEGKTVAALADGAVATAAKQDSSLVVTGGQIQIDTPAVIVHAGLPYVSDLELLDLATAKLNVKSISRAVLEVVGSRGLWAGETFAKLKEWRQRGVADAWGNPPLAAGLADVSINASWNTGGRACFRQIDPLPLTVVAAIREVVVGGT